MEHGTTILEAAKQTRAGRSATKWVNGCSRTYAPKPRVCRPALLVGVNRIGRRAIVSGCARTCVHLATLSPEIRKNLKLVRAHYGLAASSWRGVPAGWPVGATGVRENPSPIACPRRRVERRLCRRPVFGQSSRHPFLWSAGCVCGFRSLARCEDGRARCPSPWRAQAQRSPFRG